MDANPGIHRVETMGYLNQGRGDRKGDGLPGVLDREFGPWETSLAVPVLGIVATSVIVIYLYAPFSSAVSPATALAIEKVTTTLRTETNRELARRRNRSDDDGLNELCNEAVQQAVETIVDRTIQRVIAENRVDGSEEIRPLPIEQMQESMARHNCARE